MVWERQKAIFFFLLCLVISLFSEFINIFITLGIMLLEDKLPSSETDFRGLGVGTVLTTLTSSLRWLNGPRMI